MQAELRMRQEGFALFLSLVSEVEKWAKWSQEKKKKENEQTKPGDFAEVETALFWTLLTSFISSRAAEKVSFLLFFQKCAFFRIPDFDDMIFNQPTIRTKNNAFQNKTLSPKQIIVWINFFFAHSKNKSFAARLVRTHLVEKAPICEHRFELVVILTGNGMLGQTRRADGNI